MLVGVHEFAVVQALEMTDADVAGIAELPAPVSAIQLGHEAVAEKRRRLGLDAQAATTNGGAKDADEDALARWD